MKNNLVCLSQLECSISISFSCFNKNSLGEKLTFSSTTNGAAMEKLVKLLKW